MISSASVRPQRNFFPEGEIRGGLLGSLEGLAEGLGFLGTVDAIEADAFNCAIVQDFGVSPSRTEKIGPVKSNASTADKEEMKKPKVRQKNQQSGLNGEQAISI